jgi:hypothetical protein
MLILSGIERSFVEKSPIATLHLPAATPPAAQSTVLPPSSSTCLTTIAFLCL